jgi:hypothetical protein
MSYSLVYVVYERYEKRKASLEQERALDKLLKDGGEE